jgi:hypothetical protein
MIAGVSLLATIVSSRNPSRPLATKQQPRRPGGLTAVRKRKGGWPFGRTPHSHSLSVGVSVAHYCELGDSSCHVPGTVVLLVTVRSVIAKLSMALWL